jgi:hypothetical protein
VGFLSTAFAGVFKLLFSAPTFACMQLIVGIPLEMVHGQWRTAGVYLMGGLAGSLASSVFDPETNLVGYVCKQVSSGDWLGLVRSWCHNRCVTCAGHLQGSMRLLVHM